MNFEIDTVYHIYNRGNNKEDIFLGRDNFFYFLGLVKKYLDLIIDFYSYYLLPNHFHLIFKIKPREELPIEFVSGKD